MHKKSAGILLYRLKNKHLEVLLVHPGGPFFTRKDSGAWSVPKGEFMDDENPLDAAKREFKEEIGVEVPGTDFTKLNPIEQKNNKTVYVWVVEGDLDSTKIKSNTFELEWPPKSGRKHAFPEIDRGEWFDVATAKKKINVKQIPLIEELVRLIKIQ